MHEFVDLTCFTGEVNQIHYLNYVNSILPYGKLPLNRVHRDDLLVLEPNFIPKLHMKTLENI